MTSAVAGKDDIATRLIQTRLRRRNNTGGRTQNAAIGLLGAVGMAQTACYGTAKP